MLGWFVGWLVEWLFFFSRKERPDYDADTGEAGVTGEPEVDKAKEKSPWEGKREGWRDTFLREIRKKSARVDSMLGR